MDCVTTGICDITVDPLVAFFSLFYFYTTDASLLTMDLLLLKYAPVISKYISQNFFLISKLAPISMAELQCLCTVNHYLFTRPILKKIIVNIKTFPLKFRFSFVGSVPCF